MDTEQAATPDKLIEALERFDHERRTARAERIRWIDRYNVTLGGVVAGPMAEMSLLNEARECFINGHYIATLMLATALIEHVITGELIEVSRTKPGKDVPFIQAIRLARDSALFPDMLLDDADRLRVLRNPFAHRKADDHEHSLGNRFMAQQRHPDQVLEEDARTAVVAMYGHFKHVLNRANLAAGVSAPKL
jgi:hypothetical protein